MSWRLTEWGKTRMPLPGIPWRDMTDEEFAAASSAAPGLDERGYFEPVPETKPASPQRPPPWT